MALGKGLDALLGGSAFLSPLSPSGSPTSIPITQIEPGLNQPRKHFDEESLAALTDSIAQHGIIQPIALRRMGDESYQIISGERRWRAAVKAGLSEVPAVILEADDQKVMELGLIENLQREDLNPMEEAAGYRALVETFGLTQEDCAKRVSKSRSAVANTMRLLALPQEIQWDIEQGTLSAGHGRALLAVPDRERQLALSREIQRRNLSVRETEELIRREAPQKPKSEVSPLRPWFEAAEKRLSAGLGRRVTIHQGRKRGKITLEYDGRRDLEALMEALSTLPGKEAPLEGGRKQAKE